MGRKCRDPFAFAKPLIPRQSLAIIRLDYRDRIISKLDARALFMMTSDLELPFSNEPEELQKRLHTHACLLHTSNLNRRKQKPWKSELGFLLSPN